MHIRRQIGDFGKWWATEIEISRPHWPTHHKSMICELGCTYSRGRMIEWKVEHWIHKTTNLDHNCSLQNSERPKDFTHENDWLVGWLWNSWDHKSQVYTCADDPKFTGPHKAPRTPKIPLGRMIYWMAVYWIHECRLWFHLCSFRHQKSRLH